MRRILILVLALGLLATLALPAHATIVESGRYVGGDEFTIDECDFDIQGEASWQGHYRIREGKGQATDTATPFFLHDKSRWEEILTGNGTTITIRGNEVVNEVRARHVEDAVFEFTVHRAGTLAVYDAQGKLIARDRGLTRFTYLFDKQDHPHEPGGEFLEMIDVQFRGPHPFEHMTGEEFCALFE